jgi:hypothetical protein
MAYPDAEIGKKIPTYPNSFLPVWELSLDIVLNGINIETSPPIQFRIEWAGSQEKSPLFGYRPI